VHDSPLYDWFQRRPWILDVPVAVVLVLLTLLPFPGSPPGWWPLIGLSVLPLVVRRRWPALAFASVSLGLGLRVIPVENMLPGDLAFLVAIYSLSAYDRRRWARLAGLGVAAIGSVAAGFRFTTVDGELASAMTIVATAAACAAAALSAWMLGDLKRTRRQRLADLEERAERLEREREQELRLAAEEERSRIAREMHDVVAHALSVIVVQADGAAYAAERSPRDTRAQSVAALKTIGATARDALGETRRLVGVLRDPSSDAELVPAGGLDHVPELVEGVRAAGVAVVLRDDRVAGGRPIPLSTDLAAYRVVQEALTNVIKHAGAGVSAEVALEQSGDDLRISVRDNGIEASSHADGQGHGMAGMRERVAVHGGVLTVGPGVAGGWEVRATLPVPSGGEQ